MIVIPGTEHFLHSLGNAPCICYLVAKNALALMIILLQVPLIRANVLLNGLALWYRENSIFYLYAYVLIIFILI
jgi:hypothetical protein